MTYQEPDTAVTVRAAEGFDIAEALYLAARAAAYRSEDSELLGMNESKAVVRQYGDAFVRSKANYTNRCDNIKVNYLVCDIDTIDRLRKGAPTLLRPDGSKWKEPLALRGTGA